MNNSDETTNKGNQDMSNEVLIIEMAGPAQNQGNAVGAMGKPLTTQFLDIGELSAELNAKTKIVRIKSINSGFFYKLGGVGVSAAVNTDGNIWLSTDHYDDIETGVGITHVDTAV